MESMYSLGVICGKFFAGAVLGLFPFIVALIKKRIPLAVILLIACGLVSFIHPILSIAVSIVSGIILCFMRKNA